jgi:hypothetical protein
MTVRTSELWPSTLVTMKRCITMYIMLELEARHISCMLAGWVTVEFVGGKVFFCSGTSDFFLSHEFLTSENKLLFVQNAMK